MNDKKIMKLVKVFVIYFNSLLDIIALFKEVFLLLSQFDIAFPYFKVNSRLSSIILSIASKSLIEIM